MKNKLDERMKKQKDMLDFEEFEELNIKQDSGNSHLNYKTLANTINKDLE